MSSDVIRTLKWVFGKGGLIEEYKRQEQMLEETPKSVASMTRILHPRFPVISRESIWNSLRRAHSSSLWRRFRRFRRGIWEVLRVLPTS